LSTLRGKCWAARTALEANITSLMLAMGMPALFAFFWASPSVMSLQGGPICLQIKPMHIRPHGNHVERMKTATVGIKVLEDHESCHPHVEGVGAFEVVVPDLINRVAKK
jgi:hypothetical protein